MKHSIIIVVLIIQNKSNLLGTPLKEGKGVFEIIKLEITNVAMINSQAGVSWNTTRQDKTKAAKGLGSPVKYKV